MTESASAPFVNPTERSAAELAALPAPEGFRPINMGGAFMQHNGPLYARKVESRIQIGFRVQAQHCNPMGMCHGGMLSTFCDMLLPSVAIHQTTMERRFLPTISLQVDFLAGAALGAWVQGEGDVLRTTRNMVFIQGLVSADDVPIVRTSGIFKMGPLMTQIGPADSYNLPSGKAG